MIGTVLFLMPSIDLSWSQGQPRLEWRGTQMWMLVGWFLKGPLRRLSDTEIKDTLVLCFELGCLFLNLPCFQS